jgi:two-component system LytT family response regulator
MSAPAPLRVLVADDEAIARKRLVRLLGALPDVVLAGECGDAQEVLTAVRGGEVDVVLLDIQMPELSGLEALQLFPVGGPLVIFCTAHAAHAVAAFDVGAVDYVLKPIDGGRLRKALERARQRMTTSGADSAALPAGAAAVDRLALPTRNGIVLVDPRDVTHAQLADELVTVYASGQAYLSALSLQEIEARLPPPAFVRVHRRALVNLKHIVRLLPNEVGGFVAETSGGHSVEVSRQSARELRKLLGLR